MLKRTLPLAIVLLASLAPLPALARPCCDERGAHATLELCDAHSSSCPSAVATSAAKAKSRATALARTPVRGKAKHASVMPAAPVSELAPAREVAPSRAIALPATPTRAPVRNDSAPRIGPMVLSHQDFQI